MPKESIRIRLQSDLIDSLQAEANDKGVTRSEHIREILQNRYEAGELRQQMDSLQERLESRESRIRELENQLRERSRIEEKVDT